MDNILFPRTLYVRRAFTNVHASSNDLNIVVTWYSIDDTSNSTNVTVSVYISLWTYMQTYVPERYIPLAPTATSRDDYLGRAISQQRGTFTPHVSAVSRESFRASSRDSPLTLSARTTVNRGTKFRREARYSSKLNRRTWNARGCDGRIATFFMQTAGTFRLKNL